MPSIAANWSRRSAAVLGAVFLIGAAVAQTQTPLRIKPQAEPTPGGVLADAAQIGAARVIVGVVFDATLPAKQASHVLEIHTSIPEGWDHASLCGRVLSPDALYEGLAEYSVPPEDTGHAVLEFPGKPEHWKTLRERQNDELAVAVTRGQCSQPSKTFLVASLEPLADRTENEGVTIFVNSQGASRVFAEIRQSDQQRVSVPCDRADERGGIAFDRVCQIDPVNLPSQGETTISINRITFGAPEKPVTISIQSASTR